MPLLIPVGVVVPQDLWTSVMLVGAGLIAGTVNSIAGGGSLLTLPLLIFVGLPPTVANASNRIGVLIGGIGGTATFHRKKLIPWEWVRFALPPAMVGVLLGTWGAMTIGDVAFEKVLAGILVAAAAWMIWHPITPPVDGLPTGPDPAKRWLLRGVFFVLGWYSGFIQAGVGFLFLALLSSNGLDLVRGNAVKLPLILAFTVLSVVIFWYNGMLDWGAGLTLAVGQFFGGQLGVHLQVLKGQAWVRNVLTVAIVVFALKLFIGG